jgi:hypothetical protein
MRANAQAGHRILPQLSNNPESLAERCLDKMVTSVLFQQKSGSKWRQTPQIYR